MNLNDIVDPLANLMGEWSAQINIASILLRIAIAHFGLFYNYRK